MSAGYLLKLLSLRDHKRKSFGGSGRHLQAFRAFLHPSYFQGVSPNKGAGNLCIVYFHTDAQLPRLFQVAHALEHKHNDEYRDFSCYFLNLQNAPRIHYFFELQTAILCTHLYLSIEPMQ